MKEKFKYLNKILYPYYWLERKIVIYIINKYLINHAEINVISLTIENKYPFWLRQYDDYNKSIFYDSYILPSIQISYKPVKESLKQKCIITFEILKYKLRRYNFNFDYIENI